ncbi:FMN-binding protein [Candidatus Saccharibacteria bacterium]|nr:FMN-binding protein [Candidatus Saccharibacteria bacterium]
MKKTILILLAVAVLGVLAVYFVRIEDRTPTSSAAIKSGTYSNGTFKGVSAETAYGPVEIKIVIENGKIIDVVYLDMPSDDGRSTEITGFSSPALKENTLKAQSAEIDFVSGATITSYGYQQSLQAALDKASGSEVNYRNSEV